MRTSGIFGARPLIVIGALLLPPLVGCSERAPPGSGEASPVLTKFATSRPVAPTLTPRVELVDSTTACVIDSYMVTVVCDDRSWSDPVQYGREGEGPNEYLDLSGLIAGPDGTLGVLDYRSRKLIKFRPGGEPAGGIPVPGRFRPLAPFTDDLVLGVFGDLGLGRFSAPLAWVDIDSGRRVRTDTLIHASELTREHPYPSMNGALLPDSSIAVLVKDSVFAWYARDGRFREEFAIQGYGGRLPTSEEVEEYVEVGRSVTGRPPPPEHLETFRETPVWVVASGAPMEVDHRGRLWVLTTVREERSTLLAVFDVPELLSLVPVEGWVRWLDIRQDILVTLVQRPEEGLGQWSLAWYRVR